jgi:hypothetical protein
VATACSGRLFAVSAERLRLFLVFSDVLVRKKIPQSIFVFSQCLHSDLLHFKLYPPACWVATTRQAVVLIAGRFREKNDQNCLCKIEKVYLTIFCISFITHIDRQINRKMGPCQACAWNSKSVVAGPEQRTARAALANPNAHLHIDRSTQQPSLSRHLARS